MQKRNKVLAGVLTGALVLSAGPMALAATANYNDSSVTGGSAAWQDWVKEWETVAADYTKVSLTPGADETQLNFAWYSNTTITMSPSPGWRPTPPITIPWRRTAYRARYRSTRPAASTP